VKEVNFSLNACAEVQNEEIRIKSVRVAQNSLLKLGSGSVV